MHLSSFLPFYSSKGKKIASVRSNNTFPSHLHYKRHLPFLNTVTPVSICSLTIETIEKLHCLCITKIIPSVGALKVYDSAAVFLFFNHSEWFGQDHAYIKLECVNDRSKFIFFVENLQTDAIVYNFQLSVSNMFLIPYFFLLSSYLRCSYSITSLCGTARIKGTVNAVYQRHFYFRPHV